MNFPSNADSVKATVALANSRPFDLAALTPKEKDAPGLIASRQVEPERVLETDWYKRECNIVEGVRIYSSDSSRKNHDLK
ncbi:MAG: hypothetical protein WKF66_13395 [Pedobacter sp.]